MDRRCTRGGHEAHGLSGIIVNLGGNVAVSGTKPTGDPWRVGIRDPRDPSQLIGAVPLGCGIGRHEWRLRALLHRARRHLLPPYPRSAHGTPRRNRRGRRHRHLREIHRRGGLLYHPGLALGLERGLALARRHPEILQAFFIAPDGTITNAR